MLALINSLGVLDENRQQIGWQADSIDGRVTAQAQTTETQFDRAQADVEASGCHPR